MSDQFKEGDIVRLKSGGPRMTVTDVQTDLRMVRCVWFAGYQVYRDDFRVSTLKLDDGRTMTAWIG